MRHFQKGHKKNARVVFWESFVIAGDFRHPNINPKNRKKGIFPLCNGINMVHLVADLGQHSQLL